MSKILLVAGLLDSGDIPRIIEKNLIELGHEALFLPVDENLPFLEYSLHKRGKRHSRLSLALFSRRLYKQAKNFQPDILLLYGSNWAVRPLVLWTIKRDFNCQIILWEGNIQFWTWFQAEALRCYDIVFVNDSYIVPLLKGPAGVKNVFHLPFNMCDPDIHRAQELSEQEKKHYGSDIGFIGMGHPERREFFKNLIEFDLKLWGKNWDMSKELSPFFINERIGMKEKLRIYQCARINVNIQSQTYQINGISAKIFEIASCGGFFLTEKKKDISLFFTEQEEEMICFSSIGELKEKIKYYLAHPDERKKCAERISNKVISNFTFRHKLNEMMSHIRV